MRTLERLATATIPVEESFAEWRKDPKYGAASNALEDEFSLVANMPIGNPGELTEAGDRASIGHAGQAEIEAVGQQPRHQDSRIRNRFAAA